MEHYAVYPFPLGQLRIGYGDGAVTLLARTDGPACEAGRTALTEMVYGQVMEYWGGRRCSFDFPYVLRGTEFQLRVWRALCAIPYGGTCTYGELAAAVGAPGAARAVGMACHRNPVMLAVPCHRVIGANGALTGYAGGLEMKEALLRLERENGRIGK